MPGIDGPELSRILTAEHPERRVLHMSGYTDEAIGRHGLLDPATHLIEKPFAADALLRKVRDVLDGPRAGRE